jgi:hypothetical protein
VLVQLVELTLTRLDESEIGETALHREWRAITGAPRTEAAFCEAAARLGVDPYDSSSDIITAVEEIGSSLPHHLVVDFLDGVDPAELSQSLHWVRAALQSVESDDGPRDPKLAPLRAAATSVMSDLDVAVDRPWEFGYRQALRTRQVLGLDVASPVDMRAFVRTSVLNGTFGIEGVGTSSGRLRLVLGRERRPPHTRFAEARALWSAIAVDRSAFLVTTATTWRQQVSRAFAAEFLAPASGIVALLGGPGSRLPEDLDDLADHFGVAVTVVHRQVENLSHRHL